MSVELQAFRTAIDRLDAAMAASAGEPKDDLIRDAVLFRFWLALDLVAPMLQVTLRESFAELAHGLTVGELLRLARTHGFLPDADKWLAFFAARYDPPEILDIERCFEQARSFTVRAKTLLTALASLQKRDERARQELAGDVETSNQ